MGGIEGGREGGREGGKERVREGGEDGVVGRREREGWREDGGREGGRGWLYAPASCSYSMPHRCLNTINYVLRVYIVVVLEYVYFERLCNSQVNLLSIIQQISQ